MKNALIALSLASLVSACSDGTFGGQSGHAAASPQPAQAAGSENASAGGAGAAGGSGLSAAEPTDPTPEQDAIGKCLRQWGTTPFDASVYTNYREIDAAVTVFGGGGYAVSDTDPTNGPELVVVHASVSVLGSANYLLMNPNGWYCIMTDVNVQSNSEIDLQCKAHLASNQVQVNVGSNADNTAAVGVNVFSNVKVKHEADENGGGC